MGQIANCQYVIDAINAKWEKSYTPASGTASLAANCEYLLKAIDRANNYTTAFGTSARATMQLVDTNAVNQAVNTLWVPGSKFVAIISSGNKAAYSADGTNWTAATLSSFLNWHSITYGNGKFVAVAQSSNKAAYSTDGINWTETTMPSSANWSSVAYGNGKFVAVASGSNKAAYSTDGINWTETTLLSSSYWSNRQTRLKGRIQTMKFYPGIFRPKLPLDRIPLFIPRDLPCFKF
jgi:hypothetical protein